jgi:DNA-binding NtrC family response regulator
VSTLIGKSKAIAYLQKEIKRLSKNHDDVLIIGERGTGKGYVAEEIHRTSRIHTEISFFLPIKPETLSNIDLKTVLEGCEKGIIGLHDASRPGTPRGTKKGIVLIEEIERVSFKHQATITRLIKDKKLHRADKTEKSVDIRLIITAKDDVQKLAKKNEILQELADELSSLKELRLVPLRDRPEDIPHFVQHFITSVSEHIGIQEPVLDINALDVLMRQKWSGNIHELKSVIERSVLFSSEGTFKLPAEMTDGSLKITKMLEKVLVADGREIQQSLDSIEKGIISSALSRFGNNIPKAAEFLGMPAGKLESRLVKLDIKSRTT